MKQVITVPFSPSILEGIQAPAFVKLAGVEDLSNLSKVPDTGFGLIVLEKDATLRMFPVYNDTATWLSGQQLNQTWKGLSKTAAAIAARSILGAAEVFDVPVPESLRKVAAMIPVSEKSFNRYYTPSEKETTGSHSGQDKYASQEVFDLHGSIMPIRNITELDSAEHWFDRNCEKLAYVDQFNLANFIETRNKSLYKSNEKLASTAYRSHKVQKLATLNAWNPMLSQELMKRASFCKGAENIKSYMNASAGASAIKVGNFASAIDFVHSIDKIAEVTQLYDRFIPNPINTVMSHIETGGEKSTREDKHEIPLRSYGDMNDETYSIGRSISVGEIRQAAKSGKLYRILGDSLATSLASNPVEVYNALPDPVKRLIVHEVNKP